MQSKPLEAQTSKTRVVIVNDTRVISMVERVAVIHQGLAIVGVAHDVDGAVALIARERPDLVIADLRLPYVSGKILLEKLAQFPPMRKLMIFPRSQYDGKIKASLEKMGADACIDRMGIGRDPKALGEVIRKVILSRADSEAAGTSMGSWSRGTSTAAAARLFPVPRDEDNRLRALATLDLANDNEDAQFDRLTAHLARTAGFPICLITFIDRDTQWIKSAHGYPRGSVKRAEAMCNYVLFGGETVMTSNAAQDDRFRHHDAVVSAPHVRAYVGHPIVSKRGVRLGTICLLDTHARRITPDVVVNLRGMCEIAADIIHSRGMATSGSS